MFGAVAPSLYVASRNERPALAMLRLTAVPERSVVRLTGGCGEMSVEDSCHMEAIFTEAFQGFQGAMLFGGTRMIDRQTGRAWPSITEIAPLVRAANPTCVTMGVVPKTGEFKLTSDGLVIDDAEQKPWQTIIHPHQDICLALQEGVDELSPWDAEWKECVRIVDDLRKFALWNSALVVWNGGSVTSREIEAVAGRDWPVILIRGSGRAADKYALDENFLQAYPSVHVVEKDASALAEALYEVGVLNGERQLECVLAT